MAKNVIASDDKSAAGERLAAIERDSKWQNLITRFAFTAMLAVGIAYIAVSAIIIIQMSDLKVGMAALQTGQTEIRSYVVDLKDDKVAVKTRLEIE